MKTNGVCRKCGAFVLASTAFVLTNSPLVSGNAPNTPPVGTKEMII